MAAKVLIDVDGNFNKNVGRDLNFSDENCPVGVVSIVGVQSTGKSTLLNSCFETNFSVMDPTYGVNRTTKGIYIAACQPPQDAPHKILVLDIEGTDSRDREDNNAFESQTTLFALAMSNTVIFNMRCDSLNLNHGSSSPLIKTVLQVMVRKFSSRRHINLVFVLRDRNECPPKVLKQQVDQHLNEIWDGMSMAPDTATLKDYFNVEVVVMPHYTHESSEFKKEVENMREYIFSLVGSGQLDPASGFIALAQKNWKDIKEDKILNTLSNRIAVSEAFCIKYGQQKLRMFHEDKKWLQIQFGVKSGIVKDFGSHVSSILDRFLFKYDEETQHLEETPRNEQRVQLTELLLQDVKPHYISLLEKMRAISCAEFQKEIVEKIRKSSCTFEKSKRYECISQFKNLLSGARIQQANWDDMSDQQLQVLESEMTSNEKAACYIIEIQKEIKELEIKHAIAATATSVIVVGAVASGVGAIAAAAAATTTAAVTASAAAASASASAPIVSLVGFSRKIKEKKSHLKEACKRDPIIQALVNQI